jgi:hypothetical protein
MNWEPIETAPKDGTQILVYCGDVWAVVYWWDGYGGVWRVAADVNGWNESDELSSTPTHWMSLPEPPT